MGSNNYFLLLESPNTFSLVKKFMDLDMNKDNHLTFSEIMIAFKHSIHPSKVQNKKLTIFRLMIFLRSLTLTRME